MSAPAHPLALPPTFSPDTLDALAELSIVLAKVRAGIQSSSAAAAGLPTTAPDPGETLSFKEVPGATDGLKHKLQRARAQVRALPDMDRSLDEQAQEMRDLETRIENQRALLKRLRDEAGAVKGVKDEAPMQDDAMQE